MRSQLDANKPAPAAAKAASRLVTCPACNAQGPDLATHVCPVAKAAKVPKCNWHGISACDGPLLRRYVGQAGKAASAMWCEQHYLLYEAARGGDKGTGTPCDQPPGLLPKPRMAHVAGSHDEDLLEKVLRGR